MAARNGACRSQANNLILLFSAGSSVVKNPVTVASPRPYPIQTGSPVRRLLAIVTNLSFSLWRRPSHFSSSPASSRLLGGLVLAQRSMAATSDLRMVCQERPYLAATCDSGIEEAS